MVRVVAAISGRLPNLCLAFRAERRDEISMGMVTETNATLLMRLQSPSLSHHL